MTVGIQTKSERRPWCESGAALAEVGDGHERNQHHQRL